MALCMKSCYCCLTTADKVDIVMSTFGKITRLSDIEASPYPQLVCGRILPVRSVLESPISGKPCVYYEALAEEQVERTDENGLTGDPDPSNPNKVWQIKCTEIVAADFTLHDPAAPHVYLYVPGTQVPIKVHANEEKKRKAEIFRPKNVPPHTLDFLVRNDVISTQNSGDALRKMIMRYREAIFENGEAIAVLGIVKDITDESGANVKVLLPITTDAFTDEFCKSKGWNERDRHCWRDLTEEPSIILTDIERFLQDAAIKQIPSRKSIAQMLMVDLKLHSKALNERAKKSELEHKTEAKKDLSAAIVEKRGKEEVNRINSYVVYSSGKQVDPRTIQIGEVGAELFQKTLPATEESHTDVKGSMAAVARRGIADEAVVVNQSMKR